MTIFKTADGHSPITDKQVKNAAEALKSAYTAAAAYVAAVRADGFEMDITETHCADVAWESLATYEDWDTRHVFGWNDFETEWKRLNHEFPFVLMANGIAYEQKDDGRLVPAFDPDTLGEGEGGYPTFFEDENKAARWHNVPPVLWEVTIDTFSRIYETGVYAEEPMIVMTYNEEE